ncbi:MAG: hypothetical protein AAF745_01895 [Planctomycetota bacterium]
MATRSIAPDRRQRFEQLSNHLSLPEQWNDLIHDARPLWAPVSSRIGHRVQRHRYLSRHLSSIALAARHTGARWLIGHGTAIEPWAIHSAKTYGVDWTSISSDELKIDINSAVVALADRVHALHVRSSGLIAKLLSHRIKYDPVSVRVALGHNGTESFGLDLLAMGAIGCYLPAEHSDSFEHVLPAQVNVCDFAEIDSDAWLVHCTRATQGPWPNQTWDRYRDDLLLGSWQTASRTPLDTLCRIVHSGILVAGAVASRHADPVVCFSNAPLKQLLAKRTYRSHLKRWDYEPYGIAIRVDAAREAGVLPVTYVNAIPKQHAVDSYLHVARGHTVDWTHEREWRCKGNLDLTRLPIDAVALFVPDSVSLNTIQAVNVNGWKTCIVDSSNE